MYVFMEELESILELIETFNTNSKVEKSIEKIQSKISIIKGNKDGIEKMNEKDFKKKIDTITKSNLGKIYDENDEFYNELVLSGLIYSKEFEKFFVKNFDVSRLDATTTTVSRLVGIEDCSSILGFKNILGFNFFGTITKLQDKLIFIIFTIKDGQLEFSLIEEIYHKKKINEEKILEKILSQISTRNIVKIDDKFLIKELSSTLNYLEDISKKPLENFLKKIGG